MCSEEKTGRIGVYPGNFDPPTNGHLDIVRRSASLFDTLIVGVFATPAQPVHFSGDEQVELWKEVLATEGLSHVHVESYTGLSVDFVRSVGGNAMIKGLRSQHDFEAEFQQGLMNRKLAPEIEIICLLTNLPHVFVSSCLLKEVTQLGGEVTDLLPVPVRRALLRKFAGERFFLKN